MYRYFPIALTLALLGAGATSCPDECEVYYRSKEIPLEIGADRPGGYAVGDTIWVEGQFDQRVGSFGSQQIVGTGLVSLLAFSADSAGMLSQATTDQLLPVTGRSTPAGSYPGGAGRVYQFNCVEEVCDLHFGLRILAPGRYLLRVPSLSATTAAAEIAGCSDVVGIHPLVPPRADLAAAGIPLPQDIVVGDRTVRIEDSPFAGQALFLVE